MVLNFKNANITPVCTVVSINPVDFKIKNKNYYGTHFYEHFHTNLFINVAGLTSYKYDTTDNHKRFLNTNQSFTCASLYLAVTCLYPPRYWF